MSKFLSNNVVVNGKRLPGAWVVNIEADRAFSIDKFTCEIANTSYIDGKIIINDTAITIDTHGANNDAYKPTLTQK